MDLLSLEEQKRFIQARVHERLQMLRSDEVRYNPLETVVLIRDNTLPDHKLKNGDLGTVVEVYEPGGLEVEFVRASGNTEALVTLKIDAVRPTTDSDLIAVRSLKR